MAGLPEIWPGPCKSAFKPLCPHTLCANKGGVVDIGALKILALPRLA